MTTMAAKALGAGRVAVVDMNQANLEVHSFWALPLWNTRMLQLPSAV